MNSIEKSSSTLSAYNEQNVLTVESGGTLKGQYHEDELKIHNRINNTAIGIIIAGFVLIAGAFIYMICTGNNEIGKIGTIAGIITEFISGLLFWFVTKTSDDKWKYFNALSDAEKEERIIKLINSQSSNEFKQRMIEKIVNTYCQNVAENEEES